MGIHGLSKLIGESASRAIKKGEIKQHFGRKVAIDASMSIYQFLIAVRSEGQQLQNELGETTSHLMGMFYRTIRLVENGIKPLYVFDGKPPQLKSGQLAKRLDRRNNATKNMEQARELGQQEEVDKYSRQTVKVTRQHNEECQQLLTLMGIPYFVAPGEAEAQCAKLCKGGKVYAAASEDMDTLTFGSPVLLRHLTFSEQRKLPIEEFRLDVALEDLGLTHEQFVDLCILLGCDYCDSIRGIGPHRAYTMIKSHGSLEEVIKSLDKEKFQIPEDWPFEEARSLFFQPDAADVSELHFHWTPPNEEGLLDYLVKQKGFNEQRVKSGIAKLAAGCKVLAQSRLDSFMKAVPSKRPPPTPTTTTTAAAAAKKSNKKFKRKLK